VSLPLLLLADDSEAVLAFCRAALAGHYQLATASNGVEAWEAVQAMQPAGVLLDLSMPLLDGDEVLARMQQRQRLRRIPVLILSSEEVRARECLRKGARAFLRKPVRARELLAAVNRELDAASREERAGLWPVLPLLFGAREVAVPLDAVEAVVPQVLTRRRPEGPRWLREEIDVHGQQVPVLDLCLRLGPAHSARLEDRQLVIARQGESRLALCVDAVREPEELSRDEHARIPDDLPARALLGVVSSVRGPLPVLDPHAKELLEEQPAFPPAGSAP
jgi:CheY-like chemotaxis protein/chemotaxis signal transduction protein